MEQKGKAKTSSIVRRINSSIQMKRLGQFLLADLFFGLLGSLFACAAVEFSMGKFLPFADRELIYQNGGKGISSMTYTVTSELQTFSVPLGKILTAAFIIMVVVFAFQLIGWIMEWPVQNKKLRKFMRPLDEIALTAERLSSASLDPGKMRDLEEAIEHVTDSENSISIGDSDLMGLENAINNMLKRLRVSYEEQARFVDDASHELRTPIAVIQGYSSMLERWGMDDRATLEEGIHAIYEESNHMKELVDQLLFLARGDGGRHQLNSEEIRAEDLLREVCEESEMIDPGHKYILRPSENCIFWADRGMIKQAVRILTDNAAKYTPKGGSITLHCETSADDAVLLSVQDEGIGIDGEGAAHMFERFFRGDEVRGNTKGSGLGLSIAKWIVDKHEGTIDVISYKDVGTRMTIRLPRKVNREE